MLAASLVQRRVRASPRRVRAVANSLDGRVAVRPDEPCPVNVSATFPDTVSLGRVILRIRAARPFGRRADSHHSLWYGRSPGGKREQMAYESRLALIRFDLPEHMDRRAVVCSNQVANRAGFGPRT